MKLYILIAFMFTCGYVSAQQKDSIHVIFKDTINIRGYVYYDNGRPAYGTQLTSANKELQYDHFSLATITDSTGYFELKGAKVEDTIAVRAPFNRGKYFNRRARYMIITLPAPLPQEFYNKNLLTVSAIRIKPKHQPGFKIKSYQAPSFEVFGTSEVIPEFPGGTTRFYNYINKKLSYPQQAISANIEGRVEVAFTVTKNGILKNFAITKGLGYGCDEVVLQILKKSPKWTPAIFNGRPLEVTYTVSIDFKLTDK